MTAEEQKLILLVDDDIMYLKMLHGALMKYYRVAVAKNGDQALAYLKKNKPDLVLLDYFMPVKSGREVFKIMQSDPATMDIPVIFLTGANDSESVMEVLKLKPAGYVLKSTSLKDIFDTIYNFFRKQSESEDDIFAF
ncbi:putative two-component system response regulator [Oribacterium sp. KHPX15]|uniref:response regulator n=1 Tax=unclassified Oribacterium TaxID=2629782 RepID=UPI000679866F|nr:MULTISPECIES: response regulator [unclassified Oribacterium]SEA27582.1 putative two-component system response regulator [Oribacterium sp. KHPX15]